MRRGTRLPGFGNLQNTTIGVLATNVGLTKPEATKVAQLGMVGFARALSPPHTAVDGDALFCLSVGDLPADLTAIGLVSADVVARAIVRAVKAAAALPNLPAWSDRQR
jgi:L-aminopeptidase/D-esterase-like protein